MSPPSNPDTAALLIGEVYIPKLLQSLLEVPPLGGSLNHFKKGFNISTNLERVIDPNF